MAMVNKGTADSVHIWARRQEAVDTCDKLEIADVASTNLRRVLEGASLVILATPIGAMPELARGICKVAGTLDANFLVTDVGSVKAPVVEEVGGILKENGISFIGSHPMAGSEQTGIEASTADLFVGAPCILTPGPDTAGDQASRLRRFWEGLGARVSELPPGTHDEIVGRISHLPHIAACALAIAALELNSAAGAFAGSGFRDSTRIAGGDPELWLGILRENRQALVNPLRDLHAQVGRALAMIEDFDEESVLQFLEQARTLRKDNVSAAKPSS
jgi:prephenate dehydrogenase